MRSKEKFRGCLIGGAAGDALGYAVEFMEDADIFRKYGENGITEYDLYKGTAQISDDTQMTLFTATGLLLGTTRGMPASWARMRITSAIVTKTGIARRRSSIHYRRSIIIPGLSMFRNCSADVRPGIPVCLL